jgi:hypothetical protein
MSSNVDPHIARSVHGAIVQRFPLFPRDVSGEISRYLRVNGLTITYHGRYVATGGGGKGVIVFAINGGVVHMCRCEYYGNDGKYATKFYRTSLQYDPPEGSVRSVLRYVKGSLWMGEPHLAQRSCLNGLPRNGMVQLHSSDSIVLMTNDRKTIEFHTLIRLTEIIDCGDEVQIHIEGRQFVYKKRPDLYPDYSFNCHYIAPDIIAFTTFVSVPADVAASYDAYTYEEVLAWIQAIGGWGAEGKNIVTMCEGRGIHDVYLCGGRYIVTRSPRHYHNTRLNAYALRTESGDIGEVRDQCDPVLIPCEFVEIIADRYAPVFYVTKSISHTPRVPFEAFRHEIVDDERYFCHHRKIKLK